LSVPLAPSDQQKLIVAEIEKEFSRLDEAVTGLKRAKVNLKRYKAAVLKAAVEGKLTEQWRKEHPDVEPAGKLLERVLAERRKKWEEVELAKMKAQGKEPKDDKWKRKYKESDPPKPEETFRIPDTWAWSNLGQLSWSVKDGPHYSPQYSETGIPFITGGNIRPEGIDFSTAKHVTPELHAELSKRCKPEYGDLLYTKGGTTGIARVNTETREFDVWVHVAVLKLVNLIERFYLQHVLNSPFCHRQSQRYTHGVGNQDLGLTRMIWITVPIPPLEEQRVILKEIEQRLSIVGDVEEQITKNEKRIQRLRQSILKKAFSGRLVLQIENQSPN
jgi:type I restriction enzyme S subunit